MENLIASNAGMQLAAYHTDYCGPFNKLSKNNFINLVKMSIAKLPTLQELILEQNSNSQLKN